MNASPAANLPELTVVVVPFGGRMRLVEWLEAMRRQEDPPSLELLVPCDERIEDVGSLRRGFPEARFLDLRGRRTWAEQRASAVREARAPVVAITEDHCLPDPGWSRACVRAHAGPHAAVGGPIEKLEPDGAIGWALYLSDFGRYMGPVGEGPSEWLSDCNSSYKRSALAPIEEIWRSELHETTVNWTLRERGERLHLDPSMTVRQRRPLPLGTALRERYAFGRLFASTRVEAVSPARRVLLAALFWLVPVVRAARAGAYVVGRRRHRGAFLRALPVMLLLDSFWAVGELTGTITGAPGGTLRRVPAE